MRSKKILCLQTQKLSTKIYKQLVYMTKLKQFFEVHLLKYGVFQLFSLTFQIYYLH
jgi:hypothetical protein